MKKKAKRYQEGGVLRDRFGNPVRSGSGEAVRTRYPERSYDEQSTADMTESSDYSGRRMKSPERSMSDMDSDSSYMPSGRTPSIGYGGGEDEEPRRTITSRKLSEDETPSAEVIKKKKTITRKPAVKTPKRASQSFGVDESGMEERRNAASAFASKPTTRGRTAAEIRSGKPAGEETKSGFGPKFTYGTPEQLEKARKSYYSGFESKPTRSAADIRAGRGMKSGGKVSASSRADGIAQRGKTKGRIC